MDTSMPPEEGYGALYKSVSLINNCSLALLRAGHTELALQILMETTHHLSRRDSTEDTMRFVRLCHSRRNTVQSVLRTTPPTNTHQSDVRTVNVDEESLTLLAQRVVASHGTLLYLVFSNELTTYVPCDEMLSVMLYNLVVTHLVWLGASKQSPVDSVLLSCRHMLLFARRLAGPNTKQLTHKRTLVLQLALLKVTSLISGQWGLGLLDESRQCERELAELIHRVIIEMKPILWMEFPAASAA